MKKESSEKLRGHLNTLGFKQIDDQHFDGSSIHDPVTNVVTIKILLVSMCISGGEASVVNVKRAFLHGKFQGGEEIYMEIPEGWRDHYPKNAVLRLKKTLYGLNQAAMAFWRELLRCMKSMDMKRSLADPCLYYQWNPLGLVIIVSWIVNNLIIGSAINVKIIKKAMMD